MKGIHLYFVLIKFQVPGASGSLVFTQTKGVQSGKGHNSVSVLQNSVKSHLNMDPKQYSEFQDPSSSNSLHIVLTRFSIIIIAKSKKEHNSINVLQNSLKS